MMTFCFLQAPAFGNGHPVSPEGKKIKKMLTFIHA